MRPASSRLTAALTATALSALPAAVAAYAGARQTLNSRKGPSMKLPSILLSVLTCAAVSLAVPGQASAKAPAKPHDFDGDGRTDLVINAHRSAKSGESGHGAVAVLYGRSKRAKTHRKQVITRNSRGVASVADHGDYFGETTASADFDRDGYADLAITGRNEDGVTIVYGSKKGLSSRTAFLRTAKASGDRRNELEVGDFDRDGRPDLVATVLNQYWIFSRVGKGKPRSSRTGEIPAAEGRSPYQLKPAVGDFTGDGRQDLVLGTDDSAGFLLKNSRSGLGAPAAIPGFRDPHALVAGDFNGDRIDDLATVNWDGVRIHLGRPSGLAKPRTVTGKVNGLSVTGGAPRAIAAADVNRDGRDDLAISAPFAGPKNSGRVTLLYGHRSGLTTRGGQVFSQKTKGLKASPEKNDLFGWAVRLVDVTGDGRPELVVGSPGEDGKSGRVYVLPNAKKKITAKGAGQYRQKSFGLRGSEFGFYLAP